VTRQLGSWLELITGAEGLVGERGGVKVALRECSRLIGVAQPLAGAWLRAIPGPSQFRLRSSLYVIALQRWLGLPIVGGQRVETLEAPLRPIPPNDARGCKLSVFRLKALRVTIKT